MCYGTRWYSENMCNNIGNGQYRKRDIFITWALNGHGMVRGDSMKTGENVWIGGEMYRKVQEVIALYEKLDKRVTTKDIVREALKQYLPKVKEALDMKIREEATKKDRVWQALFGRENLKW